LRIVPCLRRRSSRQPIVVGTIIPAEEARASQSRAKFGENVPFFLRVLFLVSLTLKLPKLRELMQGFHTLTGLKIVLFDAEYREVLACPETQSPFCRLLRS